MSSKLPPNPNLQQLRKQAKRLLKMHRAGDADASARFVACLPRLSGVGASEVGQARLALADAQSVIAREYGFDSWARLAREVESLASQSETPHEQLIGRIAGLIEQDPAASAALVTQRLSRHPRDVAILMIALGQETTGQVLEHLTDKQTERIAQSISDLDVVTTEQEDAVLEAFEQSLMAGHYVAKGGLDYARGALEKAIGPQKAKAALDPIEIGILKTRVEALIDERPEDAASVLESLGKEIARHVEEIADEAKGSLDAGAERADTKAALEAFERLMMTLKYLDRGGEDYARGALEKAVGPGRAQRLLEQAQVITGRSE